MEQGARSTSSTACILSIQGRYHGYIRDSLLPLHTSHLAQNLEIHITLRSEQHHSHSKQQRYNKQQHSLQLNSRLYLTHTLFSTLSVRPQTRNRAAFYLPRPLLRDLRSSLFREISQLIDKYRQYRPMPNKMPKQSFHTLTHGHNINNDDGRAVAELFQTNVIEAMRRRQRRWRRLAVRPIDLTNILTEFVSGLEKSRLKLNLCQPVVETGFNRLKLIKASLNS